MRIPPTASPEIRESFRELWQALDRLNGPLNVDLRGRVVTNAGGAIDPFDLTTLDDVQRLIAAIPPATVTASDTNKPALLSGTHDQRLARAPGTVAEHGLFWETDRAALYQRQSVLGSPTWVLVMCRPLRTADPKPSDLGTDDAGFTWFDQVEGVTYRWSGGAWNYYLGSLVDVYANRPDPALADRGFLFFASDRGYHCWRKGATDWVLLEGVGGSMRGTLSPDTKPSLGTLDAGFRFYATDFLREYRWDGSAWDDLFAWDRLTIVWCLWNPGSGYQLCNGSTVTRSTKAGGTASYTVPDLVTDKRFLRASSSVGTTGGNATAHTHQVNPPATDSDVPSTDDEVQSGTGGWVASTTHTHSVDIAEFASGGPSGTAGADALPPYYEAMPYVRL